MGKDFHYMYLVQCWEMIADTFSCLLKMNSAGQELRYQRLVMEIVDYEVYETQSGYYEVR